MTAEAFADEYGDDDGTEDAETDELVRIFLSGGLQSGRTTATTTTTTTTATTALGAQLVGGSDDWSRNSLHVARFRAAADSGRPEEEGQVQRMKGGFRAVASDGGRPDEPGEGDGSGNDDADGAQALPGIGRGGGTPRQVRGLKVRPGTPFSPPLFFTSQRKLPSLT